MAPLCHGIGYQGISLEALCRRLVAADVELVIDVRERAWSQRPDFRKGKLKSALNDAGIRYEHFALAGNPFRPQNGAAPDFRTCAAQYQRHIRSLPCLLTALYHLMLDNRVAFLCYEADTNCCHRNVLVKAIDRHAGEVRYKNL